MRVLAALAAVLVWASVPHGLAAQAAARDTHELLNATLWIQTAAEHHALCRGLFASADRALDAALADATATAALEQTGSFAKLPPAIIADLDETILDNSPFAGRLIADRIPFDAKVWSDWVARAEAEPLPGAIEFLRSAQSKGVTIFYVTNRTADQETATRANLAKMGLSLPVSVDTVLMNKERPEWGSDKTTRRAFVAASYRILLMLGDDLGDFVAGARDTVEKRAALADQHRDSWGTRWFLIPNPMNGSWEQAVYGNTFPPDPEVLRRKIAATTLFR